MEKPWLYGVYGVPAHSSRSMLRHAAVIPRPNFKKACRTCAVFCRVSGITGASIQKDGSLRYLNSKAADHQPKMHEAVLDSVCLVLTNLQINKMNNKKIIGVDR